MTGSRPTGPRQPLTDAREALGRRAGFPILQALPLAIVLYWMYTGDYKSGAALTVADTTGKFNVHELPPGSLKRLDRGFQVYRIAHGILEGETLGSLVMHDFVADISRCLDTPGVPCVGVVKEVQRALDAGQAADFPAFKARVLFALKNRLQYQRDRGNDSAQEGMDRLFKWAPTARGDTITLIEAAERLD